MIPDFQTIMLPLLKYVADQKEHRMRDAEPYIADYFKLSEEEKKQLIPSRLQRTIYNRVFWAKTDLIRAGLFIPVGRAFKITSRGIDILKHNPSKIDRKYLSSQFPEFMEYIGGRNKGTKEGRKDEPEIIETRTPQEMIEYGHQQIIKNLSQEILTAIKKTSSDSGFFEDLVIKLLLKMGYGGSREDAGEAIGRTGDGGIDGIIKQDKLGLDAIYIQAKNQNNSVGAPLIQQFIGALANNNANKGVFITTSTFTEAARNAVQGPYRVILIDGELLSRLMIDYNIGVATKASYEVKEIDTDYFSEE